jgi:hypothetical protein
MRILLIFSIVLIALPRISPGQETKSPAASQTEIETLAAKQVRFLSDSDPAHHYLEIVQKEAYASNPRAFRWTNDEKQREALRSLLIRMNQESDASGASFFDRIVASLNRPVPTRYEDPNSLAILNPTLQNVEAAGGHTVPVSERPRFGTLPAGTLNARTIAVPNSASRLTVVNSALFAFCYEYLKIGLPRPPKSSRC